MGHHMAPFSLKCRMRCLCVCVCVCVSGKFPYWEDSVVFLGKSLWFELEWSLSLLLLVCWTVSAWPGKIRRHMATLIALGRVCLCVCVRVLEFKEKLWVSWEPGKSEPGSGRRFQADNRLGVMECSWMRSQAASHSLEAVIWSGTKHPNNGGATC